MVTTPKARAMANHSHGIILAKARGDSKQTSQTTPQRTPMPTMRLRTGLTIRTGKHGTTPLQVRTIHNMTDPADQVRLSAAATIQWTSSLQSVWCWFNQQLMVCTASQQCCNTAGYEQDNASWFTIPTTPSRLQALIIDTGAAISVCPMTFCEHIEVIPMGDEAKKQNVTVTGEGLTIHG
eukprot:306479-Amphidinium_carterae.2